MKNPPALNEGDRVNVADLPGEVRCVNPDGSLDIEWLGDDRPSYYVPASIVVKIVEPLKVGGVIEGEEAYVALPVGSVVTDDRVYSLLFRTNAGFTDSYGSTFGPRQFSVPRVVKFLPEQVAA